MLTRKQNRAIFGLICSKTVAEAAEIAGCSESSIYKWKNNDDEFIAALREEENKIRKEIYEKTKELLPEAIGLLVSAMKEGKTTRNRYDCANALLEFFIKLLQRDRLIERIEALERGLS